MFLGALLIQLNSVDRYFAGHMGGGVISNTTVSTNHANDIAGGVYQVGNSLLLNHVTVVRNTGQTAGGLVSSTAGMIMPVQLKLIPSEQTVHPGTKL